MDSHWNLIQWNNYGVKMIKKMLRRILTATQYNLMNMDNLFKNPKMVRSLHTTAKNKKLKETNRENISQMNLIREDPLFPKMTKDSLNYMIT